MDPSHIALTQTADHAWHPPQGNRGKGRGRSRGRGRGRGGDRVGNRGRGRAGHRAPLSTTVPDTASSSSHSSHSVSNHRATPAPHGLSPHASENSDFPPHLPSTQPRTINSAAQLHVNHTASPRIRVSRPPHSPDTSRRQQYHRPNHNAPSNSRVYMPPRRDDTSSHVPNCTSRWPRQQTPSYQSHVPSANAQPLANITSISSSDSKNSLSTISSAGETPQIQTTASDWSARVWQGVGFTSNNEYAAAVLKPGSDQTSSIKVGIGRATGLSRVPDQTLLNNSSLIQYRLNELINRSDTLERSDCSLVSSNQHVSAHAAISGETAAIFEAILADFRELTMAVTASSKPEASRLAIPVYEAAADAALLGGNLDFYLVCQTRLLRDLYDDEQNLEEKEKGRVVSLDRLDEFVGYSLLYFGVFVHNGVELAKKFREMRRRTVRSSHVQYALSAITAYHTQDPIRFIALYKKGNVRQRTILHPALTFVQNLALKTIIKTYLQLERTYAASLLGMASEDEFLRLLESYRPELLPLNSQPATSFIFRLPRNGAR